MKKVILTLALAGTASVFAISAKAQAPDDASKVVATQGDEKVKIKVEELPETVKKALAADAYKEWKAESVTHNKTKNVYEVEVKKGTETKTLKFDKDGKSVD